MIVLTAGPASLVRLMRRDGASRALATSRPDDPHDEGGQTPGGFQPARDVWPSR
ncbi:hypothetical protein [Brevundimonas sp.]|uniref:hypothetical protein n=1 Tax=Brevundimonas sp. TaxID=1871086 RepID=UPI002737CB7C|nr:hypothetical protein [Brevundimonas sp.]MDP3801160.1 hypothetical protein [Brevundimonas sp.]